MAIPRVISLTEYPVHDLIVIRRLLDASLLYNSGMLLLVSFQIFSPPEVSHFMTSQESK